MTPKFKPSRTNLSGYATRARNCHGFQLIEMLIAVGILSLFMGSLLEGLSQLHQQTTAPQNQMIASNICQTLIDNARNLDWTTIQANTDNSFHPVIVNINSTGQVATGQPAYLTRQLGLDLSGSGYTYTSECAGDLFHGTVQQRFAPGVNGNQVQFTVQVSWQSENSANGNHSYQMNTIISRYGIHN